MRKDIYDGPIEAVALLTTARGLLDDVYKHADHGYATIVERCLKCPWEGVDLDLTETGVFRELVSDNILKPLIDDLDHFNGRNARDVRRTLRN